MRRFFLETGEQGYFEVVAITSHAVDEVLQVTLDVEDEDSDNDEQQLNSDTMEVTPEHPVYVEGKGWLWAENLSIGDRLRRADGGMAKVLAIERRELDEPQMVYNFTVKGPHTYFVLEAGVLVHNCGGFNDFTDFPQGILSPEHQAEISDFVARFQNAQKPIDEYGFRGITQGMFSDTHNAGRSFAAWTEYKRTYQSNDILVLGRRDDVRPWDNVKGYLTLTNPKWSLRVNDAWMQGGIDRGATFFVVSPLRLETLSDVSSHFPYTVTVREFEQLRLANYEFLFKSGNIYLVPKYR